MKIFKKIKKLNLNKSRINKKIAIFD